MSGLKETDPEVYEAIGKELNRQRYGLELIPSENFASPAVLEAQGSVLTNKYSEGYPAKRYYGGNQFIDVTETLAIERAKKLFGAEHANVQPHSGSQANMAAYFAFLEIGDRMMGLSLTHGGHLSQGSPVNFSGKWYKIIPYYLDKETQMLDYDAIKRIAEQEKPKLIQCGYTAYPRVIDFKAFREIADAVGAYFMVDMAHIAGLIAGEAHPSPVPYADVITSTTHKTLRGPRGAMVLCREKYAVSIDKAVFPGLQGGPLDHVIAAKAVCFKEAMQPNFKEYAKQIVKNAKALADELMKLGFKLVSGGTDNHLLLVDLTTKGMTGKEAQELLDSVGITVNKNTIPFDTQKPFVASGIRLGTPPLTTRGMRENEMREIGGMIATTLVSKGDATTLEKVRGQVRDICKRFPLYPSLGA
jgi:glycine hydroxymethyltransferase